MRKKERRGLSTIIGAVFMIGVIVIGINVLTWAINEQSNFAQVVSEKNMIDIERVYEKIELRDVKIEGNNKLNMTLAPCSI